MSIAKYLERHAEPEAGSIDGLGERGPWAHAVVIPARREGVASLDAVRAPAGRGALLCVLVVNASDDAIERESGARLLAAIEDRPSRWRGDAGLSLHRVDELDVLLVDRCRERPFGPRDGVGLARKIGADLVVRLAELGALGCAWIHNTDADARLPADHCERVAKLDADGRRVAAAVAPFWHVAGGDPRVDQATARYELSLRYYVAGLRHAGSAYAFFTIGSLISVPCSAYAGVRGFPRREAGEDFYLLDKLAKLGPVCSLSGAPVEIRARRSDRVPFGTGPAVESLLRGEPLRVYDPRVFEVLAELLRALGRIAVDTSEGLGALAGLAAAHPGVSELQACSHAAQQLVRRYPRHQLDRRVHELLGGFRTLKLIHGLTAVGWPKIEWARAVEQAGFCTFDPDASLDEQRRRLGGATDDG